MSILVLLIIGLCCLVALADPPPVPSSTSEVQVFSPDELIIIMSYPPFLQDDIRVRLANGEDVQSAPSGAAISSVTGEPLNVGFRERTPVPPEVLALPQYVPGATWGMTYTSKSTNYVLCKTISTGATKPVIKKNVTMTVTFYDELTDEPVAVVERTSDGTTGFVKTEISE